MNGLVRVRAHVLDRSGGGELEIWGEGGTLLFLYTAWQAVLHSAARGRTYMYKTPPTQHPALF